ncbi:hypothetical protein GW17_00054176 [Ensete ventricosum]|nr:hypothetical protein GW17_00054176 [Ensete ventricosum]
MGYRRQRAGYTDNGRGCCGWLQPSTARWGRRRGQRGPARAVVGEAGCWVHCRRGWAVVSSDDSTMVEGWRGRRQWHQREEHPMVVAVESKGGSG